MTPDGLWVYHLAMLVIPVISFSSSCFSLIALRRILNSISTSSKITKLVILFVCTYNSNCKRFHQTINSYVYILSKNKSKK
jgi:hypothetical protein